MCHALLGKGGSNNITRQVFEALFILQPSGFTTIHVESIPPSAGFIIFSMMTSVIFLEFCIPLAGAAHIIALLCICKNSKNLPCNNGTISLLRYRGPDLMIWKIYATRFLEKDAGMNLEETKLCPNCARQGQIFPNSSKRNQK
jgi:EamA domain-containing membrane protein RarD